MSEKVAVVAGRAAKEGRKGGENVVDDISCLVQLFDVGIKLE